MKGLILVFIFLSANLYYSSSLRAEVTTLTFGATDWCPYTCESREDGGIVTKYLKKIFSEVGIEINVRFYPWIRAVRFARQGEIDGLLTAVKSEVPDLLLTTTPTMSYQTCFYGLPNNSWSYTGAASLAKVKALSVAEGYGYGEPLDGYIGKHAHNINFISGDRIMERMINMVKKNRVTIIAQDPLIIEQNRPKLKLHNKGCQEVSPFYIAFKKDPFYQNELIPKLDQVLAQHAEKFLPQLLEEYNETKTTSVDN